MHQAIRKTKFTNLLLILTSLFFGVLVFAQTNRKTTVSIKDNQFYINDELTYKGRFWEGNKIEGLLMNSRMVQGIFDDLNPETVDVFKYPDTQKWDANRNTNGFIANMSEWHKHGLLAFSLNLQGGGPFGYKNHNWINSTFDEKGNAQSATLKPIAPITDFSYDFEDLFLQRTE